MGRMRITSPGWRLGVTYGVPGVGIAWAAVQLGRLWDDGATAKYPWWALGIASVAALVLFTVLEAAAASLAAPNRRQYGWLAVVIGADGRLSTSKFQAMLWTVTLGVAIVYFGAVEALDPSGTARPFDEATWEQYLVLLGGPFAAAVLAKVAVTQKLQAGTIQRTVTAAASAESATVAAAVAGDAGGGANAQVAVAATPARAADLVSNDAAEIDLVDTQYLAFNVMAFLYFVVVLLGQVFATSFGVERFELPAMPDVVLGLTSLSAATYVGNKAAIKDPPRISVVLPAQPSAGDAVKVLGVNLVPSGLDGAAAQAATYVVLQEAVDSPAADATAVVALDGPPTSTSASFRMPDFAGKHVLVRLVTAGSVATAPYPVTVKA